MAGDAAWLVEPAIRYSACPLLALGPASNPFPSPVFALQQALVGAGRLADRCGNVGGKECLKILRLSANRGRCIGNTTRHCQRGMAAKGCVRRLSRRVYSQEKHIPQLREFPLWPLGERDECRDRR